MQIPSKMSGISARWITFFGQTLTNLEEVDVLKNLLNAGHAFQDEHAHHHRSFDGKGLSHTC